MEHQSLQTPHAKDQKMHPVLGLVYRVSILTTGNRGAKGTQEVDVIGSRAKMSRNAIGSGSKQATPTEPEQEEKEDASGSTSSENYWSSSSSSSHAKTKKQQKKTKKNKKCCKNDANKKKDAESKGGTDGEGFAFFFGTKGVASEGVEEKEEISDGFSDPNPEDKE